MMRSTLRPAISPASFVAWRSASLKYAGTVMTASVTVSPRYASASRFSFCRMRAEISCGVYFLPSTSNFQSVPMWRLTEAIVLSTFVTAWRFAVSPTRTSPSFANATIEGVVRRPSALAMTFGSPPSRTATTEFVVPRSIPTARAMTCSVSLRNSRDLSRDGSTIRRPRKRVKKVEPVRLKFIRSSHVREIDGELLHGFWALLAGADPDHLQHVGDPDLAVSDGAGSRRLLDRAERGVELLVGHDDLDQDLGQEVDLHSLGAVDLDLAGLGATALRVDDRHAGDADLVERDLHGVQSAGLHDCGNELHVDSFWLGADVVEVVCRLGVERAVEARALDRVRHAEADGLLDDEGDDPRHHEGVHENDRN